MTIRSTGGRVAAYAWLVFAALNLVDIVFGVTGDAKLSANTFGLGAVLLLGCGVAYTVGLRPAIIGDDDGITLRNPLRDVRVPWAAVRRIEGGHVLTVSFTGADETETVSRAWVHQTSPRAQAKADARARREQTGGQSHGADLRGRTPTRYAAQQLEEMRDRLRPKTRSGAPDKAAAAEAEAGDAHGTVTWSVPALASLLVPLVALIVIVVVSSVS
ncbi:PH domain-containing protein [Actinomadura decatromicini]|uniref:PH domain-containing protein n=1 Tax=Actinomadura decatromicini TaxID=2604572 RepID=A0A5D3F538_9ACTN|nr:PH domain-containing protein [Actinomadura decatromicini]TYK43263.1 PH domain-containing protein [Actinomadura decatromicini]